MPLAKTMAEIIGELEVGLPDLHEVKLVQGEDQVGDICLVQGPKEHLSCFETRVQASLLYVAILIGSRRGHLTELCH